MLRRGLLRPGPVDVALEVVADGFSFPLYVTAPPDDLDRLFVVEQNGRIKVVENGSVKGTPFLDLGSLTSASEERGLLSMAFHPEYGSNGYF